MEYDNFDQKITGTYPFLADKEVGKWFAKVDYYLRAGTHIQREFPTPAGIYRFLDKHYESLKPYYAELFEMILCKAGSEWQAYFYIDFQEGSRGKLPNDNQYRYYLRTEFILIGLIFFKLYKIDGNIDLLRISEFIDRLYAEYDELYQKLQRLVTSLNQDGGSDLNDGRLNQIVIKAFDEFEALGWISREPADRDLFTYQPSFERLRRLYYPQIENLDELIKTKGHA
jgi:hypothetical protein